MITRLALLALASATTLLAQDRAWTRETVQAFRPGARAVLDLAVGEYRLVPGQDDAVKVRWSTRHADQMDRARIHMELRGDTLKVRTWGPKDDFRVTIELPRRTDLDAHLSVGQLRVGPFEGHLRVDLNVGEAIVEVPDAKAFRRATASVRVGELRATPFGHTQEGLMNRFTWNGPGSFDFQAKVAVGELVIR